MAKAAVDTTTTSLPDYGALSGVNLFAATSGVYAAGTASTSRGNGNAYYTTQFPGGSRARFAANQFAQQTGSIGGGFGRVCVARVLINKIGSTVEWFIGGLKIATITNATFTAGNVFIGYWDSYTSVSDNAALSFGLVDNVRVERFVTNVPPYITAQPESVQHHGQQRTLQQSPPAARRAGVSMALQRHEPRGRHRQQLHAAQCPGDSCGKLFRGRDEQQWFDHERGGDVDVDAKRSVAVHLHRRAAGRHCALGVTGDPGFNVLLQTSTNLVDWSALTNLVNPTGTLSFTNTPALDVPYQFFRALYP
jgi:hypothetical protein